MPSGLTILPLFPGVTVSPGPAPRHVASLQVVCALFTFVAHSRQMPTRCEPDCPGNRVHSPGRHSISTKNNMCRLRVGARDEFLLAVRRCAARGISTILSRSEPCRVAESDEYKPPQTCSVVWCPPKTMDVECPAPRGKGFSTRPKELWAIPRAGPGGSSVRQYGWRRELLPARRTLFQINVLWPRNNISASPGCLSQPFDVAG